MAGNLTKDIRTTYTPGSPGVPGSAGSPFIPAYTSQVTTSNDVALVRMNGSEPFYVPSWFTALEIVQWAVKPERFTAFPPTTTRTVYHPAVAAVAPTAGVPGTPAQLSHDFNIGWNSGAVSKTVLGGDCDFILTVAASAVGIVAGLNSSNEGVGYREIDHGLYFSRGKATVYEAGSAKTAAFAFTAAESFTVRRSGAVVTYLQNADVLYTSLVASTGGVFADASLYMGGDAIASASFAIAAIQHGSSAASLLALGGTASNKGVASSRAALPALAGEAYSLAHGSSTASLSAINGAASNKAVASSRGQLAPLTATSASGELAPSYTLAAGSFAYLLGAARGLTGEVGSSEASFAPLQGLAADRPYATAAGALQPLGAFSTFTIPLAPGAHASITAAAPMAKLYATMHDSTGENAANISAPMASARGYLGAAARIKAPTPTLAASATGTNWLSASLTAPAGTVSAAGTVSGTAQADITAPMASLVGYAGMVCSITLTGKATVQATVSSGSVASANIAAPMARLTLFELTAEAYSRANIVAPAGQMGGTLQAWLIAPAGKLTAIGTAVVAASYEAYSVNLSHNAGNPAPVDEVTRYTHFPFTHIVRYQNSYFGVAADGLYLLEGTLDDGAAIPYALKTCIDDFKKPELKNVASAYLSGRIGPDMTVSLHAGETGSESYDYSTARGQTAQNHREKFGRGVRNRYFALGLAGTDALELDMIELEINPTKRRI